MKGYVGKKRVEDKGGSRTMRTRGAFPVKTDLRSLVEFVEEHEKGESSLEAFTQFLEIRAATRIWEITGEGNTARVR